MTSFKSRNLVLLALGALCAASLHAAIVKDMDLAEVCANADKVFRGTVVGATEGVVEVGGGELPTVIYSFKVNEAFKGEFVTKGDESYAEVQMLGRIKSAPAGDLQHLSVLPDLPELVIGQEYVIMTTAPSAGGLSVPVGLGQGLYGLSGQGKTETATNGAGASLTYVDLASQIRATLGQ